MQKIKLIEIYTNYQVPPNLQKHMLRVGSVTQTLLEKINSSEFDYSTVLEAALLHDLANIIKFDFINYPDVEDSEHSTQYWIEVQQKMSDKYKTNEHHATLLICEELGVRKQVIEIIKLADWPNIVNPTLESNAKLLIYCDMRVGPKGVIKLQERFADLFKRDTLRGKAAAVDAGSKTKTAQSALEFESYLETNYKIGQIDPKSIEQKLHLLKDFEIILEK